MSVKGGPDESKVLGFGDFQDIGVIFFEASGSRLEKRVKTGFFLGAG